MVALATYEFDIQNRPGRSNIDADILSRHPHDADLSGEWVALPVLRLDL